MVSAGPQFSIEQRDFAEKVCLNTKSFKNLETESQEGLGSV